LPGAKKFAVRLRRAILRAVVPEVVWPRTVPLPNGGTFPVRGMDFSFGVKKSLTDRSYEAPEAALVSSLAHPGMQVVEMGASIGFITSVVAHGVGPAGRVVSLEGAPRLAARLAEWLPRRYPWVEVVAGIGVPVWEASGLGVAGFDDGGPSLGGRARLSPSVEDTRTVQAPVDLATLCRQHAVTPELLVIDVEGSESAVLTTPPRLPQHVRDIVLELHPALYEPEVTAGDILGAFEREGFRTVVRRGDVVHLARRQGSRQSAVQ